MLRKNRKNAGTLVMMLVLSLLLSAAVPWTGELVYAAEQKDTIVISSAADLIELADSCSLDAWSRDKKVVLDCSISLKNTDFMPIPTFGGTFDGQGHTISGLHLTDSISPAGLFGIIQEGGSVQNLHVSGVLTPGGEQTEIGGVCGKNYGLIRDCSFEGIIAGEENVGGIVGINGLTGTIKDCSVQGNLTGEKRTGGIAGYNQGTVADCINKSHVNTESMDPELELEDFQSLEELLRTTAAETYNIATDTGGICGYSSGLILACTNEGNAGYMHIGYNVGGIAGRSSGHISTCKNTGQIYGRKDVGGVAGQMEPYIVLKVSDDWIQSLQKEMKTLNSMINGVADHLETSSAVLSAHMENLNNGMGVAGQLTYALAGGLAEAGKETVSEINRAGEILQASAAQLEVIARNGVSVSASLGYALQQLELAVEEMEAVSALGTGILRHVEEAVKDMNLGKKDFAEGSELVLQGIASLKNVLPDDREAVEDALQTVQAGLKQIYQGFSGMRDALQDLRTALEGEEILNDEVEAALKSAEDALQTQADAMKTMAEGAEKIMKSTELNLEELKESFLIIKKGADRFAAAGQNLDSALKELEAALTALRATSGQMTAALDQIADAVNGFRGVAWTMTGMLSEVENLFTYLASVDPIQIAHTDPKVALAAGALYGTFSSLEEELHTLNGSLTSMAAETAGDIRRINNQFMVVMDTLLGAVYSLQDSDTAMLEDTSDEDIDRITSGKVYGSENRGTVYGDVNVGGISGTMAVESELDPEDDLESMMDSGLQQTYELKCILQNCVNYGQVTSRKNCVGGACGKEDLGLITGCENYGMICSETGRYAGGIAGSASSAIRSSYVKSFLSGNAYVGGIAGVIPEGEAGSVKNCRSMVEILSCQQYAGAVCGGDNGSFSKNYFVSDTLAGLNRVSLAGKAEPVSYKKLLKTKNLPSAFRNFTVTFTDGEQVLKTLKFEYGDSFDETVFPAIPEKEDHYGTWSRTELKNLRMDCVVTAEYHRYVTALESFAQRSDGRPVFFAEGLFMEGDQLTAVQDYSLEEENIGTVTEVWNLEIPDDGQDIHQIRYLKPTEQDGAVSVFVLQNGKWTQADCEEFGSYVIFKAEGPDIQVRAESGAHSSMKMLVLTVCGSAVLLAAAVIFSRIFIRRKKKNASQPPVG